MLTASSSSGSPFRRCLASADTCQLVYRICVLYHTIGSSLFFYFAEFYYKMVLLCVLNDFEAFYAHERFILTVPIRKMDLVISFTNQTRLPVRFDFTVFSRLEPEAIYQTILVECMKNLNLFRCHSCFVSTHGEACSPLRQATKNP